MMKSKREKKAKGRQVTRTMPERIPDTPENVASACMQGPPKEDWRYFKKDLKD